jgi:PAS domain S-box-containing protein
MRYSVPRTALLYAVLTGLYIMALDLSLDLLTVGVSRHPAARLVLVVATVSLSFFFLSRELQVHWHAEQVLRQARDELEVRVHERTAGLAQANEALRTEVAGRKQTEAKLLEAESRYRSLVEHIPAITYITAIDETGTTLYISPQIKTLLGFSPADCQNDPHFRETHLHPDDQPRVQAEFTHCSTTGEPFTSEYRVVARDGRVLTFRDEAVLVRGADGRPLCIQGVMFDITDRNRAEEALLRYADQQSALYQISLEINAHSDVPTLLQTIIERATKLSGALGGALYLIKPDGQTLELVVGYHLAPYSVGVTLHLGDGVAGRVAQSGRPLIVEDYRTWEGRASAFADSPYSLILGVPLKVQDRVIGVIVFTGDKKTTPFSEEHVRLLHLFGAQAAIAIENARLYEEAQKTASHLQTMSQRLVEAQETERRNVARELHDQIGQLITGLKLRLEMCARLPDDTLRGALGDAQTLVRELLERVRELSLDLRPTMLDDLGLVPALLWLFERFTAQTNVQVALKHAGIELRRFAPKVETAAYRITQEALTNIARHAHASAVTVRLWATPEMLTVQIQDDGVGFDPEAVLADSISTGLSSMRERATLLGGHLEIESSPNAGARLTAELPLNELEVPEGLAIQGSQKQGQT